MAPPELPLRPKCPLLALSRPARIPRHKGHEDNPLKARFESESTFFSRRSARAERHTRSRFLLRRSHWEGGGETCPFSVNPLRRRTQEDVRKREDSDKQTSRVMGTHYQWRGFSHSFVRQSPMAVVVLFHFLRRITKYISRVLR